MIQATDLKRGAHVNLDGEPWTVVELNSQTPSARGGSVLVKARLRSLTTGLVLDKTFRGGEMLEEADLDRRKARVMYRQGDDVHLMDLETYDQFSLPVDELGDSAGYLLDDMAVTALYFEGRVLSVTLPQAVELEVVACEPSLKGATAQAQTKPATLETGLVVHVPSYVEAGERIVVDTRDGHFVGRAR
ncbi:MAG TPA: elongation factor P [Thermoanaerobaculia bacterium]|nr:elongation factor P [Thermoanaerobaculia bacterium]